MYKDKANKMVTEVVTNIPDEDYWDEKDRHKKKFKGSVIVENWKGERIKGYYFGKNNTVYNLIQIDQDDFKTSTLYCDVIFWYSCNHDYTDCVYTHTEIVRCYDIEGGESGNQAGGGGNNYLPEGPVAPPCNDDGPPEQQFGDCPTIEPEITKPVVDTTINITNPQALCIINNLKTNDFFHRMIVDFTKNSNLNLKFEMDDLPPNVAGRTSHEPGTTNFSITIDNSYFNQVGGIEVTKTFLHEAFHANLWIKAKEWYPNDLPANFQNYSLLEQIQYLDS